ncbi:uncharacterized protein KGF55_001004 [Candida pseudojiufengensis]|uniref:uncharacterized protein n=1 Tax=Candida pseudojiufengensis TaxID=497109 RepID=UPI0022240503|nr:uncharacterized protein KGF55_001004 [Candida pseudojiufengensis]KAI5965642.1 hypothetical protein KGF55_001004 [Candida pseudojiufengensis]
MHKLRLNSQSSAHITKQLTTTTSNNAIPLTKPSVTGSGPFAATPSIHPIGNPSNILSVALPQSSQFFINSNSLLGINGDLSHISSESINFFGHVYQLLKSSQSSNLIINGNSNYKVLGINKQSNWTIYNLNKIIGWSGTDIIFKPSTKSSSILEVDGNNGCLIINGGEFSKVTEVEVDQNSEILVNPNSLIAIDSATNGIEPLIITPNKYKLHTLEHTIHWPRSIVQPIKEFNRSIGNYMKKSSDTIKNVFNPIAPYTAPFLHLLSSSWNYIYSHINGRFIRSRPIFYKIQGPSKILIDNEPVISNNKIFTNNEINYIFAKQNS